jgi:hypothetical protein
MGASLPVTVNALAPCGSRYMYKWIRIVLMWSLIVRPQTVD